MKQLSNDQIDEIAERIDLGDSCFINSDTCEMIFMMNDEALSNYGISWEEDEDEDVEGENERGQMEGGWWDEMYADIKANMAKIDSWQHVIRIEKPEPHESFEFMERFVDEIIPEGKLKERFCTALSRKHPFSNFNDIVHDCEYREEWFAFKQRELEKYVREEIGKSGFGEE